MPKTDLGVEEPRSSLRCHVVRLLRVRRAALGIGGGFALALSIHGVARADEPSDLQGLLSETYVKGASKTTESNAAAPAVSTTLTSDDIRRYGIHSLDEAINFLSLGAFTSNSIGTMDIGS